MKCPFCGEEMQQGKLRTRGENYFVPDGCKTPMLYTKVGSTSIVGVEKKEIVSSGAGSTLGTAFMCGKTGYVF